MAETDDASAQTPQQTPDTGHTPDTGQGPDSGQTPDSGQASAAERTGTRFVFIDTEATGLDHSRHELTEVSWIVRFEDGSEVERQYFPDHTLDGADEAALELTHYTERIAPQDKTGADEWLAQFLSDAEGAVIVGAVPDFDVRHLHRMCRKLGAEPTWDHHLLDVETLALPLIAAGPERPRSLAKTCAALGVEHDEDQAHGALYDARQAKAVFDAVWETYAELRRTGGPLPAPVPAREQADDDDDRDEDDRDGGTRDEAGRDGDDPDEPGREAHPSGKDASRS